MINKITVITGHYGSGKSTFAANYAIRAAEQGDKATVVDMDTVNPYYRTADLEDIFKENGVKLIAPMYAGTNLDTPIINYDIPTLYDEGRRLIIDMGGDDAGAYPLGKFSRFIKEHEAETDIFYVVNFCRFLTHEPSEAEEILREIETACGLKATAIVNNSNLGYETDGEIIREGIKKAEELCGIAGIPIIYNTVPKLTACESVDIEKAFPMEIYIKNVWN